MENIEESEMIYEEAKEKISNLEINQVLKENLNNFNEKINKLKYF